MKEAEVNVKGKALSAWTDTRDGSRDYYTKWSKPDRERQRSYDFTYMWNLFLKKDTNELISKTDIDPQTWKTNSWLPKGKAWVEIN